MVGGQLIALISAFLSLSLSQQFEKWGGWRPGSRYSLPSSSSSSSPVAFYKTDALNKRSRLRAWYCPSVVVAFFISYTYTKQMYYTVQHCFINLAILWTCLAVYWYRSYSHMMDQSPVLFSSFFLVYQIKKKYPFASSSSSSSLFMFFHERKHVCVVKNR